MAYDDWKDIFSTLFINLDFPDDWTGVRFDSEWNQYNCPGLPKTNTEEELTRYAQNPQFLIVPKNNTEMMMSMSQTGGRLPVKKGDGSIKYYDYPFKETLRYACLAVFKVQPGEWYLKKFDLKNLVYLSPVKREKDNSGRIYLEGGQWYIMVPSCEMECSRNIVHDMFMNIYIN